MMAPTKVVIIGAGPVGSVAALYAAHRGYDVEVYELRPGKHTLRNICLSRRFFCTHFRTKSFLFVLGYHLQNVDTGCAANHKARPAPWVRLFSSMQLVLLPCMHGWILIANGFFRCNQIFGIPAQYLSTSPNQSIWCYQKEASMLSVMPISQISPRISWPLPFHYGDG